MDKELLDLIQTLSGDASLTVRTYIAWYYGYWTACALLLSGTVLAIAAMAYRLVKRTQDEIYRRD